MIPYYVLVFVPVIMSFFRIKGHDKETQRKVIVIVFFSILFLLMALKAPSVGIDTHNYIYKFKQIENLSWEKVWTLTSEPAYNLLNKVVLAFTSEFQIFLAVISAIIIIPHAWFYARESENPVLTISLLLILSNFQVFFSGLRQSISIALGLIAFEMIRRKKPVFFVLTVILAFLFHNSAIMLIFLYPLYYLRLTRKRLVFVIPVVLLIFIFNRQIFSLMLTLFSDYYSSSIIETGAYTMLFLFILFAVYGYVFLDEEEVDRDTNAMRNYLLMALVVQLFASLHPLAMRMGYYYMVFIPVLLSKMTSKSGRWRQFTVVASIVMIVFFLLYFFIKTPSQNSLSIYPYQFFWEGDFQ